MKTPCGYFGFTFISSSASLAAEANSSIERVNGCREIFWSIKLLNVFLYNCPKQGKIIYSIYDNMNAMH